VSRDSIVAGDCCVIDTISIYVIEIAKTCGGWASGAQRTAQGKDFELILTLEMETRHPV